MCSPRTKYWPTDKHHQYSLKQKTLVRTAWCILRDGERELGQVLLREVELPASGSPGRRIFPNFEPRLSVTG